MSKVASSHARIKDWILDAKSPIVGEVVAFRRKVAVQSTSMRGFCEAGRHPSAFKYKLEVSRRI